MHAVSEDLLHWRKIPEDAFFAPADRYEEHDWRDPFVFWNEEAGEYWMLLAARQKEGPVRRRGARRAVRFHGSEDVEVREPFWAPGLYTTHECPDLFRIGDWWYLVYSTFSDKTVTHYRMSRSLQGPWLAPENDTFDNRSFYAAKTWSDGQRRYAFGWNPTREGENDNGTWQWGGNLVVHEVVQQPDGSLTVRAPDSVLDVFGKRTAFSFKSEMGDWRITEGDERAEAEAVDGFAWADAGELPQRCRISATLTFGPDTRGCGSRCERRDTGSGLHAPVRAGRAASGIRPWPRKGDVPYVVGLERPVALAPEQTHVIEILLDGTVCEVYIDGTVAMSARLYDFAEGRWGVFVSEGTASFEAKLLEV